MKKLVTGLLLVFVLVSLGYFVYSELGAKDKESSSPVSGTGGGTESQAANAPDQGDSLPHPPLASSPALEKQSKVIAYYFHTTYRCPTCINIEAYAREAIEKGFPDALRDGKLEFRSVNVEEQGNRHFIQDYQLYSKSLVLVKLVEGKQLKWQNQTRVWELVRDKNSFIKYVQDATRSFLEDE